MDTEDDIVLLPAKATAQLCSLTSQACTLQYARAIIAVQSKPADSSLAPGQPWQLAEMQLIATPDQQP